MKINNQRWWDVPAALFLLGALFTAAVRLQVTNWTENLGRVEFIVILGAIFGFALGKSIFDGRITFALGTVYSLFVIPWQLGQMIPNLDWLARLNILYARLWYATADFLSNKPVRDPILFLTTMMILYWFASLLSSYRLVRHSNPWLPLLSLGGMILVIEYTVEMYRYAKITGGAYSFLYLFFCLLLMGRIYFLRSRKDWEQRGGTIEMEVGYDLGRGVMLAAVVVALLAWNTPRIVNFFDYKNPARERVSQGWQAFRDRISKAANTLRSPNPTTVESYGSNMFLGTGGNQSEQLMFTVKPDNGKQPRRMYWAARTYDQYKGGQWESTIDGAVAMGPQSVPMVYPTWAMRQTIQFTFDTKIPLLKTLFFVNEPININRAAQAIASQDKAGLTDLNAIVLDPPLKAGELYTIRAKVGVPTVLSMREATLEYPDYIKQRYLEVPSNFSPRVAELAQQIAGEEETAYDKAQAITQYLRRTITYTETVPTPPTNRDPVEWFLFEQRAGFCNYYASAEVMMLRSVGVPARLVIGYAEGTWDASTDVYSVHGKDSHAWPEVYFPELGWIQFEPTVSQPSAEFPEGQETDLGSQTNPSIGASEPTFDPFSMRGDERANQLLAEEEARLRAQKAPFLPLWAMILIPVLIVLGGLSFFGWRRRKSLDLPLPSWLEKFLDERGIRTPGWLRMWSRRALRTPMENLFANISFMLRVWGQKIDPSLTPAEQVSLLVNVVPAVKDQANTLLEEYHRAMYSQYPANTNRARQAVAEIRSIGYRNWFMRLVGLE